MTMKSFLQSLEVLKSDNACSGIELLREIKYAVIGSNLNKVQVVNSGVVPRLLQIMNEDGDIERMIEAVTVLGSLLRGPACVVSAVMRGNIVGVLFKGVWHSSLRYVERCLTCLRTIACTTVLTLSCVYEQPGLIARLVSLTTRGWSIAECVLTIFARSCLTSAHQHALLNERVVEAVRQLLSDPPFDSALSDTCSNRANVHVIYSSLRTSACDLLSAIAYRNVLIARQVANMELRPPSYWYLPCDSLSNSPTRTTSESQPCVACTVPCASSRCTACCSLPAFVAALCDSVGKERSVTASISTCRLLAFLALTLSGGDENENDCSEHPSVSSSSLRRCVVRKCVPLLAKSCKARECGPRERYDAMLTLAALVECDCFAQRFATINEQLLVNLAFSIRTSELPPCATLNPDDSTSNNGSASPGTRKRCYDAIVRDSSCSYKEGTSTGNAVGWPWLVGLATSRRLSHDGDLDRLISQSRVLSARTEPERKIQETNENSDENWRFGASVNSSCECALEQALELRYAAFQLLAVLASGDEDVRRRVVDIESSVIVAKLVETLQVSAKLTTCTAPSKCKSHRTGQLLPTGFSDERERVAIAAQLAQIASLRLLQALTRSIHLMRTHLRDAHIEKVVFETLRNAEAAEPVRVAACSIVANLLLEFSPFRDSLIREDDVLHVLVSFCKTDSSVALQLNGLHALMNATFSSDSKTKQQVVEKLTLERLLFQLVPHDCADVKLVALGLLRNLLTGRSQIDLLVAAASCNASGASCNANVSTGTTLNLSSKSTDTEGDETPSASTSCAATGRCNVSATNSILQSLVLTFESDANLAVKEQALCVLANVADGGSSTKALLLANIDLLDKLNNYAMHPSAAIQLSAVSCVQNLLDVVDDGNDALARSNERRARLRELGLLKTMQSLFGTCPNTALLEKLTQILVTDTDLSG